MVLSQWLYKSLLQARAKYSHLHSPCDCNNTYLAGSKTNKPQGKEEKHSHKHPSYPEVSLNLQGRTASEKGDGVTKASVRRAGQRAVVPH